MRQLRSETVDDTLPVLIVDDDAEVRDAFADVLRGEGFCVATATNGSDALIYLRKNGASLIFLDLKMPGIDGNAFIQLFRREARNNSRLAAIPIVVITADRPSLVPAEIPVLRKPCDLGELVALARAHKADND